MKLVIDKELPGLNKYTNANRANYYQGAKMKKEWTNYVAWCCKAQKLKPAKEPVTLTFMWYCKNKRRDPDNVVFARKFILDGMINAGVIKNDGWKNIRGWGDRWFVSKDNPRIEVKIDESN